MERLTGWLSWILRRILRGLTGRIAFSPATGSPETLHAINPPNVSFQDEFHRYLPPRFLCGRVGVLKNCRGARIVFVLRNNGRFHQSHRWLRSDALII